MGAERKWVMKMAKTIVWKVPGPEVTMTMGVRNEADGSYREGTPDDLRAACAAVGLVVLDSADVEQTQKVALELVLTQDSREQWKSAAKVGVEQLDAERAKHEKLYHEALDLRAALTTEKARAEKAEAELVAVNGRLAGERDATNHLRTKLAAAEARLSALTAPVEGEPSAGDLRAIEESTNAGEPLTTCAARRALWRAGYSACAARHEGTMPRATAHDLLRAWDVAREKAENGLNPVDLELAGLQAVATRVRAERPERPVCLVERAVKGGWDIGLSIDSDGNYFVSAGRTEEPLAANNFAPGTEQSKRGVPASDVRATLEAVLTEVGA